VTWEQQLPVLAAFVALFGTLVVPLIRYIDRQWQARLAREQQAAAEMVAKERTTNAEVTRLWQERVNREVAATAEANKRTAEANERCVAQAAAYEVKIAAAAERVDRLIGLGHAAVQTTRRAAGK
jgi:hypothetical protein